jgi:hypothetical protein
MKHLSEKRMRGDASSGKNQPIAKSSRVNPQQNGESQPSRSSARKQHGTDISRKS